MSLVLIFRVLIVVSAMSYLIYFFMPYFPSVYSGYENQILFDSSSILDSAWEFHIFNILFILWIIASIGMIFFQNWGRILFLILTLFSFVLDLILGVSTTIPIESFLVHLISTLDGALIALAFLSPVRVYFEHSG